MEPVFDYFFAQYSDYETMDIVLEITGTVFGLLSVYFSMKNNILVFPTGIISTAIYVYILLKWGLLGDMMINGYYFIMSIYGWWVWTRKVDAAHVTPITAVTKKENLYSIFIFLATAICVYTIYEYFDKWQSWVSYMDILTTAIFFVGMWLMAKRKLENWVYWIIGDLITVPLYFYKGLTFSSFQYLIFTILAIYGYKSWRTHLNKNQQAVNA
ncbi:MAG: nicotinamide mononucleotide transporter [Cytophagaceae bacterium]|nr:nicotinamide mononucleotide transporter [Cytophagaceae bacterium]|tara:strand:+ start:23894 stop:24532 length:639 start_codon:yes stop_codon:yes gene_type:complete